MTKNHLENETKEDNKNNYPPPLKLNTDEYLHHLEEFDLSEAQKKELLQSLWTLMATMVDIGFGVDTVQYFLPGIFENSSQDSSDIVEQKSNPDN